MNGPERDLGEGAAPATLSSSQPGPGVLDGIFVVFVCALAFLLASTPARNSDLWLHLASGRWLVQGHSPRSADPFTSTAANVLQVNHAWLSDVLLYGLHTIGGKTLVLGKAFLVAILAGLVFCFRRPGTPVGLLGICAGVAVVALGPWLLLQPTLLSLFGVVLTLYLLERPSLVEPDRVARARTLRWLLVPLFALWANLDGWFLLGPVLVGLYAVGSIAEWRMENGEWRTKRKQQAPPLSSHSPFSIFHSPLGLAILTLACLAACLVTPYHYRTFAWPIPLGLSHTERALMSDPLGESLVVSPFAARFVASPVFASPGAWAYYLLLAGGLGSFAWRGRALHPGRLLAWLALAVLSAYQARAIPFFAVLAGPVLALNLQDSLAHLPPAPTWRPLRVASRGVGTLIGLGLLVLAWPGWLQPAPYRPRGWLVEADDSLVRLAEQLQRWHDEQQLPDNRFSLTLSPDVAHHLAWFCPAEKGFLDSRWPLFEGVADDFVRMRRCLFQSSGPGPDPELTPLLDAYRIDRIIVRDPDWDRTVRAYRCLLGGAEWQLLALEGGAAVFGRSPPVRGQESGVRGQGPGSGSSLTPDSRPLTPDRRPAPRVFDRRRLAYHPSDPGRAPPAPVRPPQRPGLLAAFWRGGDNRSPDREEAALHLIAFDQAAQRTRLELGAQWLLAQAGGLLGCPTPSSEAAATATALAVRLSFTPLLVRSQESGVRSQESPAPGQVAADQVFAGFLARRDQGPPEALLLAVRAGRRALAANPDDAGAFLLLGEAYLRLARQTREQSWRGNLPTLTAIRRLQALTALEQAALLRPDLDQAHALLVQLYWSAGHLDRALDHLRARLKIEQQASKRGPDATSADERRAALESDVDTLQEQVDRSLKIYEANAAELTDPSKVSTRAQLAYRHGLTGKALQMLLGSHPSIFGKEGTQLQLDLMLELGRAYEVRAWLEPEYESVLGFSSYHWLRAQAAAACGDYVGVEEELDLVSQEWRQVRVSATRLLPVRTAVAQRVAEAVLVRPKPGSGPAGLAGAVFLQFDALRPLGGPAGLLRKEADILVLRGVLALEQGEVETARRHCRAAVAVWGDENRAATSAGLDFAARPIAQHVLGLLSE